MANAQDIQRELLTLWEQKLLHYWQCHLADGSIFNSININLITAITPVIQLADPALNFQTELYFQGL